MSWTRTFELAARPRRRVAAIGIVLALAAASCGGDDDNEAVTDGANATDPVTTTPATTDTDTDATEPTPVTDAAASDLSRFLLVAADVPDSLEQSDPDSVISLFDRPGDDGVCTGAPAVPLPALDDVSIAVFFTSEFTSFVTSEAFTVADGGAAEMLEYLRLESVRCDALGEFGDSYTVEEVAGLGDEAVKVDYSSDFISETGVSEIWMSRLGDDTVVFVQVIDEDSLALDGRALMEAMVSRN